VPVRQATRGISPRGDDGQAGRTTAAQIALLVAQIGSLLLSASRLREAQGRTAQAAAARRAATQVADSAERRVGEARGLVAKQARGQAAAARPAGPASTVTRRPRAPAQGPSRGR